LGSEEGEDAAACADVHHRLSLEVVEIVEEGGVVSPRPYIILEHVLLVLQHAVVMEIHLRARLLSLPVEPIFRLPLIRVNSTRRGPLQRD